MAIKLMIMKYHSHYKPENNIGVLNYLSNSNDDDDNETKDCSKYKRKQKLCWR